MAFGGHITGIPNSRTTESKSMPVLTEIYGNDMVNLPELSLAVLALADVTLSSNKTFTFVTSSMTREDLDSPKPKTMNFFFSLLARIIV